MSRCYPYPYLGNGKISQVVNGRAVQVRDLQKNGRVVQVADPGFLTKVVQKQKHKHKDKKRKGIEINGDAHDKDKRSSKKYRTGVASNVVHMENGRIQEVKVPPAVENSLERHDRDVADMPSTELPLYSKCSQPAPHNKSLEANCGVGIISSRPTGTNKSIGETATSSSQNFESDEIKHLQTAFLPQVEGFWSPVDDQEWLFLQNHLPHSLANKRPEKTGGTSKLWTEALHLPSVHVYALPYVCPY